MIQPYDRVSRLLHWVSVLLIASQIALGFYMVDLPKGPGRGEFYGLHKSIGLLFFSVFVLRVLWRLTHPAPPVPASVPGWQRRAASVVHGVLYGMMVLMPLSGYLTSVFTPNPVKFFGVLLPQWTAPDEALNGLFKLVHFYGLWCLLALLVLHIGAAVMHGWQRDGLVSRMALWRRTVPVGE